MHEKRERELRFFPGVGDRFSTSLEGGYFHLEERKKEKRKKKKSLPKITLFPCAPRFLSA